MGWDYLFILRTKSVIELKYEFSFARHSNHQKKNTEN